MVILARIVGWKIERVMIDTGTRVDILFNHCYEKMLAALKPFDHELFDFDVKIVKLRGDIKQSLSLRDCDNYVTKDIQFVVVDCFSPYNPILSRNTI